MIPFILRVSTGLLVTTIGASPFMLGGFVGWIIGGTWNAVWSGVFATLAGTITLGMLYLVGEEILEEIGF